MRSLCQINMNNREADFSDLHKSKHRLPPYQNFDNWSLNTFGLISYCPIQCNFSIDKIIVQTRHLHSPCLLVPGHVNKELCSFCQATNSPMSTRAVASAFLNRLSANLDLRQPSILHSSTLSTPFQSILNISTNNNSRTLINRTAILQLSPTLLYSAPRSPQSCHDEEACKISVSFLSKGRQSSPSASFC